MFTIFKVIKSTRKEHKCYNCNKLIKVGSNATRGVTSDDTVAQKGHLVYGYFCTDCRKIKDGI